MVRPLLSMGLLLLLVALPPAQASLNAGPATTDIQVPFDVTVEYDQPPFESLDFSGMMHVNTQVTPKGSIRIRVNLDGVSAFGPETGTRYNAVGRDEATAPFGTLITPTLDFRVVPASGTILSCILEVKLVLTFSASGQLTNVYIDHAEVVPF